MDYRGDKYYISEVLKGNTAAFSHIVNRHKDNTFNLAFRICGNREEAEEIAQDAFLKAYRSMGEFRFRASFSTWLYKIVYNTSVSYLRTRKNKPVSLEEFPAGTAGFMIETTDSDAAEAEYREAVVNFALKKLSEDERAIITLYYYDELPTEEIGEVLSLSRENVKIRLFRARRRMLEIIRNSKSQPEEVYYG